MEVASVKIQQIERYRGVVNVAACQSFEESVCLRFSVFLGNDVIEH